ncbi:zinc finger protein 271 [Nematolebias whitei]|uniref:zinc finger protein 271 n=1 Tax=Nematolebias whitei TaxID=451745 RepID=UPI00189BFE12|nr:zinc finger protein 271 [Nematolebias whitei]
MLVKAGKDSELCSDCGCSLSPLHSEPDPSSTSAAAKASDRPSRCPSCQAGSSPSNGRRSHKHLNPHSCTLCTKTFISSAHLNLHLASHDKERKFRCNICGKLFQQSAHLIVHKSIHSGDRPFKCPECGKTFGRASHLKTHRRLHTGEKPFRCIYCNKAFTQKAGLLSHIRIHTGEKPFVCEHCGARFRSQSLLLSHKAQEASGQAKPAPVRAPTLSQPKGTQGNAEDLKCGVCCRTFVHSSYIRLHVRLKKGQRPYHCKVCNKTFVKLDTFINHCDKHLKKKNELKYKVVKPPLFVPLSRSTSPETSPAQSLSSEVNTCSKAKSKSFKTEP